MRGWQLYLCLQCFENTLEPLMWRNKMKIGVVLCMPYIIIFIIKHHLDSSAAFDHFSPQAKLPPPVCVFCRKSQAYNHSLLFNHVIFYLRCPPSTISCQTQQIQVHQQVWYIKNKSYIDTNSKTETCWRFYQSITLVACLYICWKFLQWTTLRNYISAQIV